MSEKCLSCSIKKKCVCCWFRSLDPWSKRPPSMRISARTKVERRSAGRVIQDLLLPRQECAEGLRAEIAELKLILEAREQELKEVQNDIEEVLAWKPPEAALKLCNEGRPKAQVRDRDREEDGEMKRLETELEVLQQMAVDASIEAAKDPANAEAAAAAKRAEAAAQKAENNVAAIRQKEEEDESEADKRQKEDDDDDEDDFDDEDELEEFAPLQPKDPERKPAEQEPYVYDLLNEAMLALRKEQDLMTEEARRTLKQNGDPLPSNTGDGDVEAADQRIRQAAKKMSLLDRCFFNVRDYMVPLVSSLPSTKAAREALKADYQRMAPGAAASPAPSGASGDSGATDGCEMPSIIAGGSTQMGKTMFVVVGYVAAWFAEAPLVCITTTVGGTKSLHRKVLDGVARLEGCGAQGISQHCMYLASPTPGQLEYFSEDERRPDRRAAGNKGDQNLSWHVIAGLGGSSKAPDRGILFIADTAAQMKKAVRHITAVREGAVGTGAFGLLVDEADSMQRTSDERLQLEQRLQDLKGIGSGWEGPDPSGKMRTYGGRAFAGPRAIVSISATLLPVLLKMYKLGQSQPAGPEPTRSRGAGRMYTFFTKAPPSKYVGVLSDVWQPFTRSRRPVFLKKSECTGPNLGGILDGNWRDPGVGLKLDSSVLALFEDACSMPYSLLLDISVSRVNVEGASLKDKAELLGNHFREKRLTVITVDGRLIRCKLPTQEWTDDSWAVGISKRAKTVEELLNELEYKMKGDPVAIFGYSQMIRGDSFRSNFRVPTHMLQQLSNAMSVDRLVQSAGRASFIGKELLDLNAKKTDGGEQGHVRVLLPFQDYLTIRAYVEFMNMLAEEIRPPSNKSVEELFNPSKVQQKYLPHFSVLVGDKERQMRSIGNRNEKLSGLLDKRLFLEDTESEAAFACACACGDVEMQVKKAQNQSSKAIDQTKTLAARQKARDKCIYRAKMALEGAEFAAEEARRSKKAAKKFESEGLSPASIKGVRPSDKAEYDTEEAQELALSAAKSAARADASVVQAEQRDKSSKLAEKLAKLGVKADNAQQMTAGKQNTIKSALTNLKQEVSALQEQVLEVIESIKHQESKTSTKNRWAELEPAELGSLLRKCTDTKQEVDILLEQAEEAEKKVNEQILAGEGRKGAAKNASPGRNSPQPSKREKGDDATRACTKCGESGHNKRTCPKTDADFSGGRAVAKRRAGGGEGGVSKCRNCGEPGHNKRKCPKLMGGADVKKVDDVASGTMPTGRGGAVEGDGSPGEDDEAGVAGLATTSTAATASAVDSDSEVVATEPE